jgi:hypothetical protein
MEFEQALAPFRNLGAYVSIRSHPDGSRFVHGIQCYGTPAADEHIALLPQFPDLLALGLQGAPISSESLAHIAKLRRLETLDLDETRIDDAGLFHLSQMSWLEYLNIRKTSVTFEGVRDLETRLPKCEICSDWT